MSTSTERRSELQLFVDMDGVLVDFEGGVLKYMNKRFQELKDQPDHPDYKIARSTAKEIGDWDVEIDKWHIARSDMEGSLKRNYRTRDFMYRLVENVHISDNKGPFGVYKDKQGLLIDDRDKYINQFKSGGGETIKHAPSTLQNTIDELEKFGFVKE